MDSLTEDIVIGRPRRLMTTANPSGCCMCSWMSPEHPIFKRSKYGVVYLSWVTPHDMTWFVVEAR